MKSCTDSINLNIFQ